MCPTSPILGDLFENSKKSVLAISSVMEVGNSFYLGAIPTWSAIQVIRYSMRPEILRTKSWAKFDIVLKLPCDLLGPLRWELNIAETSIGQD